MSIPNAMTRAGLKVSSRRQKIQAAKALLWLLSALILSANLANAQEKAPGTRQGNAAAAQAPASESYKKLLTDAGALIKAGKFAEAYSMLEPFEFDLSGREDFDYLIGIAALDSGKPDKATLAFERVLMVNPGSASARLEMARAYYQLGDMPRAKTEFELVLGMNTSAEVRRTIEKYLDKIALHQHATNTFMRAYIEGTLGHDNNVNNSTSQLQVYVDAIATNATLDPSSVKTADQYQAWAAGGEIVHQLSAQAGVFAGADLRQRNFSTQKNFDTLAVDARTGLVLDIKNNRLQAAVSGGQYSLGGARYSDSAAVKGEWRFEFSPSNHIKVSGQRMRYSFSDAAMQTNDYVQQVGSVAWVHILPEGKSNLFASFYIGNEQDISTIVTSSTPDGGRIDGAKNLQGVRLGGQTAVTDKTTLYASAGVQDGAYSKINPLFLRQRADHLYDVTLGTNWLWDRLWTLRTQINFWKNASNIAVYEYERTDVSLSIRRDFR